MMRRQKVEFVPGLKRRGLLAAGLGWAAGGLTGCGGGDEAPAPAIVRPRLLVPAYFRDAALWAAVSAPRDPAHWIIANAASGPGSRRDETLASSIALARQGGHEVLGYVATDYTRVPLAAVLDAAARWDQLYGVRHLFVDEVAAQPSGLAYYADLIAGWRRLQPGGLIVLNPGTTPDAGYFRLDPAVEIVVFEDRWTAFSAYRFPDALRPWRARSHLIVYSAPPEALRPVYDFVRQQGLHGFFVTDASSAEYHLRLPSYWAQQAAL
ncbi:Spherulation-specific family 4 [Tepidimonas alkaliphilus]|uniref:Spherulation-specific family 4 n=1 Tax=Tepidimonas alkaliphilus TaxID=2588942 RepID=A0A554W8J5_9BURK|nr:spherulation-specific family 4 protein [Tepidimonas alkaliphilus]TSE19897.1 Spherulation-specific family 4 [Tepidimonas alkaliphilus]